jgi:hypothetical protein
MCGRVSTKRRKEGGHEIRRRREELLEEWRGSVEMFDGDV